MHTRLALVACSSLLATQGTIMPPARHSMTVGLAPSRSSATVLFESAPPTHPVPARKVVAARALPPGDWRWATRSPGVAAR